MESENHLPGPFANGDPETSHHILHRDGVPALILNGDGAIVLETEPDLLIVHFNMDGLVLDEFSKGMIFRFLFHACKNFFPRKDDPAIDPNVGAEQSLVLIDDLKGGGFDGIIWMPGDSMEYLFFRIVALILDSLRKSLPLAAPDENALFCIVFPGRYIRNFLAIDNRTEGA